ncbi:MAG: PEGA domain-containing protein [Gammaproteobacteria bacterium]
MSRNIIVVDANGERTIAAAQLPLKIGSQANADVRVPGAVTEGSRLLVDLLDDRVFLQTVSSDGVEVNGEPVSANRWLQDGDVIELSGVKISCAFDEEFRLTVDVAALEYPTLPPEVATVDVEQPEPITPVRPRARHTEHVEPSATGKRIKYLGLGALGVLLAVAAYLFTAQAVRIDVEPTDAEIKIVGGLFAPKVGGSYLLRRGEYRVLLNADGYRADRQEIEVLDAPNQSFDFVMRKLPGRIAVTTSPPVEARVFVDEEEIGTLPSDAFLVEPGEHSVRVIAERYLEFATTLTVEGRDVLQPLEVELQPGWGDVTLSSTPAGAEIFVDEEEVGITPATVPLMAGVRQLVVRTDGYKAWKKELTVEAGVPIELPPVALVEADGLLTVITSPAGAALSVDGRYRGTTPVEVELAPGRNYKVIASKAGFGTISRNIKLESRKGRTLRLTLEPRLGILRVSVDPADAELFVDGESRGAANQELSLPARPHKIEIRKAGYAPYITEISTQPGLPENLQVTLLTPEEAVLAATPSTVATADGQTLILVRPAGEFQMGAPRREQGRRPNEAQHRVKLTRPFYLGSVEVTNSRFQAFKPKHTSGAEKYRQLAIGNHPAVMLSWEEATGYCNWLSSKDGLPPAYVFENGDIVLAQPVTTGYRLPTEAEWAWAARFTGGGGQSKYPWGDRMPPPENAGNFADQSARAVLPNALSNYNDRFAITAPVGSFAPNPIGIYDLGGNVAEWVNDRYTVYTQPKGIKIDPLGPDKGQYHVIRGSGWRHSSIGELRYAYRDFGDRGRLDVGFRIARYAEPLPE